MAFFAGKYLNCFREKGTLIMKLILVPLAVLWIALHTQLTLYVCRQSHYAHAAVMLWRFFFIWGAVSPKQRE